MKKKLINFDVFKQLEKNSITNSERELAEASDLIANTLGQGYLDVFCVNENNVTFINNQGDLVYANYEIANNHLVLENIEQLVVDKSSTEKSLRSSLEKMVDNILEDKMEEASSNFADYFSTPMLRANLREGVINEVKKGGGLPPWLKAFKDKKSKKGKPSEEDNSRKGKRKKKKDHLHGNRLHKVGKKMHESKLNSLNVLSNNVLEFVSYKEDGNVFSNISVKKDAQNNVVAMKIPTSKLRNEGRIVQATTNKHSKFIQESRESAKGIMRESNWVRAVNDLKRLNAISDNQGLQTTLENVAAAWPNLLFLTENELASNIKVTLENSGAVNFDDDTCKFLAEGILRTAHKAFTNNVNKIYSSAGTVVESNDYTEFSKVAESVLARTEKERKVETQVFSDLFRGLSEVYRVAEKTGDEATKAETASLMSDVESVLSGDEKDHLRVAEEAALYLQTISEANLEGGDWTPAAPHISDVGDNPMIHKYASVNGSPGANTGPFKSSPFSDGKDVKVGVEDHYTSMKGADLFPNMENPYAPKAGEFKMKGEKSVGDDKDFGGYQTADTYPALKNPYIPDNGMTMQDSMQHLKSKD